MDPELSPHSVAIRNSFLTALRRSIPPAAPLSSTTFLPIDDLVTTSSLRAYHVGNGLSVTKLICREILAAQHDVLFVTGFWAKSPSRDLLRLTLKELSRLHGLRGGERLRVRIGFSSSSLTQKLFHTSAPKGKVYSPKSWAKKLGLPTPEEMTNLEVEVKSVFFRPVGLLHGKFVVVDKKTLLLPSGNISWEDWYEGCGMYTGGIVDRFAAFWRGVWDVSGSGRTGEEITQRWQTVEVELEYPAFLMPAPRVLSLPPGTSDRQMSVAFLPHPHQASIPPFFPLDHLPAIIYKILTKLLSPLFPIPPDDDTHLSSPQNAFFLASIDAATTSIYIHTPNLTTKPILSAILRAVKRGVVVEIVSSQKMMVLEQIVTAGRTTESCLRRLVKDVHGISTSTSASASSDALISTGGLFVYWFTPHLPPRISAHQMQNIDVGAVIKADKTHVKALIVDEEVVMMGSGNCDRASWVTSQEVNVGLFCGRDVAVAMREGLVNGLAGRVRLMPGSCWVGGADFKEEEEYGIEGRPRPRREGV